MKNYDERMENIRAKANQLKSRRRTAAVCCVLFVAVLALTLLTPYYGQDSAIEPKYQLIPNINLATYQPSGNNGDYEQLIELLASRPTSDEDYFAMEMTRAELEALLKAGLDGSNVTIDATIPSYDASTTVGGNPQYIEVTDNQVQGVIESDIFKRSDKYIYYMRSNKLSVYSIEQEDSAEIATLEFQIGQPFWWCEGIFLSSDCNTLTILFQEFVEGVDFRTVVYSLDVSDPTNILVQEPLIFWGFYRSSRMVDDKLLLIYTYDVGDNIDLDKPETFVPVYGAQNELKLLPAEDIFCPMERPTDARYTVIAQLDVSTLQVEDTVALFGGLSRVYVSQSGIYLTYGYNRYEDKGTSKVRTSYTDITGVSYRGENLNILGTVTVEGSIMDQYSMDEYNGVLRVATSTSVLEGEQFELDIKYEQIFWAITERKDNCNLYCIDLSSWEIASAVTAFAPDGDEVKSARFDGPAGYICTAEVFTMTDPVYFFDLSNIYNITYKHTPIIDGFSSSLFNFGDYLLGIGYNEDRELKVEVYKETPDGVEALASYERPGFFTEKYKSYYIDRENNLVGLARHDLNAGQYVYVLLCFDGHQLVELERIPVSSDYVYTEECRADIIDGYLYLLEETLHVKKLWVE